MNTCNGITKVTLRRAKKWFKTITKNRVNTAALNEEVKNRKPVHQISESIHAYFKSLDVKKQHISQMTDEGKKDV